MFLDIDSHGAISLESFKENLGQFQLIDVRSKIEWDEGHFDSATLMPLDRFEEEVHQLNPSLPTIFICAKGMRAAQAYKIYQQAFPDAKTSAYLVASVDYKEDKQLQAMPKEWHEEIAQYIEKI